MKAKKNTYEYFFIFLPICLIAAVVITSLFYWSIKQELDEECLGIEFFIESDSEFEAVLFYTYDTEFDETLKIANQSNATDTLLFMFPNNPGIVKKFRLDLGNNQELKEVRIKAMRLLFQDKQIILDEEEVFNGLYLNSASVFLNKENRRIEIKSKVQPFDPYIIFLPLGTFAITGSQYGLAFLLPFLALLLSFAIRYRNEYKVTILDFLLLLFIVSIPLKIAWTTFCALLLGAYVVVRALRKREIVGLNGTFYVFMALFGVLVLFGRPTDLSVIDKQLALPLFAIVSLTMSFPKYRTYSIYVLAQLVFNAIIAASGISLLLWFNEFYGLGIMDYFKDIKIHSAAVRDWLYYDHAAFLSFFGLTGLLFIQELYLQGKVKKRLVVLFHLLMVLFILLTGTRICLLIYAIFCLNLLLRMTIKKTILLNAALFMAVAFLMASNIQKIDMNRYHIWNISWQAIKERPWLGHGLGTSNELLHNAVFIDEAGFAGQLGLNHSHNQFLTFLMELGILGLAALMLVFGYCIYRTRLYRNITLVLFIFGLCYIFLTESILQTSKPLFVVCFLFLLITGRSDIKSKNP